MNLILSEMEKNYRNLAITKLKAAVEEKGKDSLEKKFRLPPVVDGNYKPESVVAALKECLSGIFKDYGTIKVELLSDDIVSIKMTRDHTRIGVPIQNMRKKK